MGLPPQAISELVQFGLQLGTQAIEQYHQDKIENLTTDQVLAAIRDLKIESAKALIAEGEAAAAAEDPGIAPNAANIVP